MSKLYQSMIKPLARRLLRSLANDHSGNVYLIVGISLIPMTLALGIGIDYSRAMRLQTKLNAVADAAALTGVSSKMMEHSATEAHDAAVSMFNAQSVGLPGLVYDSSTGLTVTVATSGALNSGRTVTVTYSARSTNAFAGILGSLTLPINGSATATAARAPNINFFLALDTSPSMLLPSTSTGLSAIRSATTNSHNANGCAFACHTQDPHADGIWVQNAAQKDMWLASNGQAWPVESVSNGHVYSKDSNGNTIDVGTTTSGHYADGYWLTRNYTSLYGGSTSIPLRVDEEQTAAQDLIPFAINSSASNKVTYQLQIFTYNWTHPGAAGPISTITTPMQDVNNLSSYTVPNFYNSQDYWYRNNCPTSTLCNNDSGTEFKNTLTSMNGIMPDPGDGSSTSSPVEVMFLVTDGLTDETLGGLRRNRELSATDLAACTAIKNRGIRIAILYTEYLPESLTGDAWSQTNVAPYLPNVPPALQQCASTSADGTPLFFQVSTDQSISNALSQLFALVVQASHLIK